MEHHVSTNYKVIFFDPAVSSLILMLNRNQSWDLAPWPFFATTQGFSSLFYIPPVSYTQSNYCRVPSLTGINKQTSMCCSLMHCNLHFMQLLILLIISTALTGICSSVHIRESPCSTELAILNAPLRARNTRFTELIIHPLTKPFFYFFLNGTCISRKCIRDVVKQTNIFSNPSVTESYWLSLLPL